MNARQIRVSTAVRVDVRANGCRVVDMYLIADLPSGPAVIATLSTEFQLRDHLAMLAQSLGRYAASLPQEIVTPDGRPANPTLPEEVA